MLAAELYGKLSPTKPPHQRMEDVLTSYVFSLFRYLNDLSFPLAFLQCAQNLGGRNLALDQINEVSVFFWPRFTLGTSRFREADVLLLLAHPKKGRTAVVVETKYESGLTNRSDGVTDGDESMDEQSETPDCYGHQLADEFCGIKCGSWLSEKICQNIHQTERKLLLYVTGNYEMPKTELQEAIRHIEERKCGKKRERTDCRIEAERDVYWVSWRHLHKILSDSTVHGSLSAGESIMLRDLLSILELRELNWFSTPFANLHPIDAYESFMKADFWSWLQPVHEYKSVFLES